MGTIYGKYEYEKREISKEESDFKTWEYKIKNTSTGVKFKCIVDISKKAFSKVKNQIQGIVEELLDDGKEERIHIVIDPKGGIRFHAKWKRQLEVSNERR
ncbi:MAG: hypothetical protein ABSH06_23715 [Thermodesulfobacteriota bacterium]|jgi:hypothetical protein